MRDAWSWRGGFSPDEIHCEPRFADAKRGPIREPAHSAWPVLDSQLEAAWATRRPGDSMLALMGPAIAHLTLCAATGGYHAVLGTETSALERDYETVRQGDESIATFGEALNRLEAGGVVERTSSGIALCRAPAMSVAQLRESRDEADEHEHGAGVQPVMGRFLRRVRRQTYGELGLRRYRELARFDRIHATVSGRPGRHANDPLFETSGQSMPPAGPGAVAMDTPLLPGRSLITPSEIEAGSAATPILATASEVGALVLGEGRGANAVRRATRAAVIWSFCVEATNGEAAEAALPIAALSRRMAEAFGLSINGDHRSRIRELLGDLQRAGVIDRTERVIHILHPPPAQMKAVRRFLDQWASTRSDPTAEATNRAFQLAERRLGRRIDVAWRSLLEQRRVNIYVGPGQKSGTADA